MWKLILSHTTASLLVAAFVAVIVGRTLDVRHQREIGAWQEKVRVQDSLLRVESHRIDSLKLAFHTDTVRLTRSLVRYDSIKDTLQVVLHDTTVQRDTLIQVVERYRDRADSVIQGCRNTLRGCEVLVAHQDTAIQVFRQRLLVEQAQSPGVLGRSLVAVKWLGVGLAAGYVYAKH